jgi:hypothetical protein
MASVPGEYKHSTAMVEFAAAQIGARWWFWLPCSPYPQLRQDRRLG